MIGLRIALLMALLLPMPSALAANLSTPEPLAFSVLPVSVDSWEEAAGQFAPD